MNSKQVNFAILHFFISLQGCTRITNFFYLPVLVQAFINVRATHLTIYYYTEQTSDYVLLSFELLTVTIKMKARHFGKLKFVFLVHSTEV